MHLFSTQNPQRRALLQAAGTAALAAAVLPARAEPAWPAKPLRLLAPFSPGGPGDEDCRAIADLLGRQLGQPAVVDNKAGAGGIIAATVLTQSPPDGYTLMGGANGVLINGLIRSKLSYKPADIVPVSGVLGTPSTILVDPRLKVGSLKELQAYARSRPEGIFFATTGIGSTSHFAGEIIKATLGIPLTFVQYKSGGESAAALLGGQVQMLSEVPSPNVVAHVTAGKMRAIAVAGAQRLPRLPQVPTTAEAGFPEIRMTHWLGIFGNRGTPDAILDRINAVIQAGIVTPEFRAFLALKNAEPMVGPRADFARFMETEGVRLGRIAKELNIAAD
ncbi:MAG: tripartite tricarboxylate transporter substrate binding protein [Pseudomonadota bacterium]